LYQERQSLMTAHRRSPWFTEGIRIAWKRGQCHDRVGVQNRVYAVPAIIVTSAGLSEKFRLVKALTTTGENPNKKTVYDELMRQVGESCLFQFCCCLQWAFASEKTESFKVGGW
jgi:hypothetical protein